MSLRFYFRALERCSIRSRESYTASDVPWEGLLYDGFVTVEVTVGMLYVQLVTVTVWV